VRSVSLAPDADSRIPSGLISIIVVVKNDRRIDQLLTRLADLHGLEPRETVVVDASRDGSLDDIRERHSNVRWLQFAAASEITVAAQRNAGVREARGDVIVFIDADCVPGEGWLDALVEPILQESESVVGGRVRSLGGESVYDRHWDRHSKAVRYLDEAPTLNLAFTRDAYERYGGFNELMRFGSDVELTWRMVAGGTRIRFAWGAVVYHDWGDSRAKVRRAFLYGEGRARLYKELPWARSRLLGSDFYFVAYAAFVAGLPVTVRFRAYPLLLLVPLLKNARSQPFRVVGLSLVAGLGFLREIVAPTVK
jgi:GT2 family glycosyltransferase